MELVRSQPPDDVLSQNLTLYLCGQALRRNAADGDMKSRISYAVFRIHQIERGGSDEKD